LGSSADSTLLTAPAVLPMRVAAAVCCMTSVFAPRWSRCRLARGL
jgi:hypothetical protein